MPLLVEDYVCVCVYIDGKFKWLAGIQRHCHNEREVAHIIVM